MSKELIDQIGVFFLKFREIDHLCRECVKVRRIVSGKVRSAEHVFPDILVRKFIQLNALSHTLFKNDLFLKFLKK